jgi:hypothetical protein
MTFDPFADDVQTDVAETVTETEPTNDVWNTEEKKESKTVTVQNTEGKLTVTLKGGAGFDAPWIVLHAEDAQDALDQLNDKALGALIARTKEVATFFSGGTGNATQRPAQSQQQRPPQQSAPNGESKTCAHGEMTFRSGVSKSSGKPYKGFFCPSQDRNAQCSPQFIR